MPSEESSVGNSAVMPILLSNSYKNIIFLEPNSHRIQKFRLIEPSKLNFLHRKLKHLLPLSIIQLNNLSLISTQVMHILEEPSISFLQHLEFIRLTLNNRDNCPSVGPI